MNNTRNKVIMIVIGGLLVAMDVLCARFLYFFTPGYVDRISLQFVPNAIAGLLFGPLGGMVICAMGDVVGMLTNSAGLTFMPLITLACAMRGLIYGLLLHNKVITPLRCAVAVLTVTVVVELGAMPVFLSILYGKAWIAILSSKLITRALTVPAYSVVLYAVIRALAHAKVPAFSDIKIGAPRRMQKTR